MLWRTARAVLYAETAYGRALAAGALGMLVHVMVHSVVDNLWVHNMYIHVAIVLGLIEGILLPKMEPTQRCARSRLI
jgi:hypothetical protein